MSTFIKNGIEYRDVGNNEVEVVGYVEPGGRPGYLPPNPRRVAEKQAEQERKDKQDARADQSAALRERGLESALEKADAATRLAQQKINIDLATKGLMIDAEGNVVANPKGPINAKASPNAKAGTYNAVINQIDRLYELYNDGIGQTEGIAGALDYLPLESNRVFDSAGAALGDQGMAAFKVPGMGPQSDADAARFVRANEPSSGDQDAVALEKLRGLRSRIENNMEAAGLPAPQWNYGLDGAPVDPQQRDDDPLAAAGVPGGPPTADQTTQYLGDAPANQPGGFVPYGQKYKTVDNPALAGVNSAIGKLIAQGVPREQIMAFAADKGVSLASDTKFGNETPMGRKWIQQNPGRPYPVNVDDMQVPLSGMQQFANNAPQTMVGTAAATALNAGGMGIPQMLAGGEGLDYLRSQNPVSAFAGDVGGVIGGTSLIGRLGSETTKRLAPSLLTRGGSKGDFGRQLLTDASYGAIYGGTTEGDPLTGALTAGVGSAGGQLLGKGIQKTFQGGGNVAAQALRDRGIPLTAGQALGGIPKRIEDGATSIPIIGDIINNRRMEGLEAFNRAAFQDAGTSISASVDDIGEAGMDALRPQISRAYDSATQGVNVPFDGEGIRGIQNAIRSGQQLPDDLRGRFDSAITNRVNPITGQLPPAPDPINGLPMPSSFNKPRNPTPEEMARYARQEDVDLAQARGGQSVMDWQRFNSGDYADPLIDGYGSKPVGIRLENGEYVVADGNHRTTMAFNQGKSSLPMDVIDARAYDPQNMGRAPNNSGMDTDELLRELGYSGQASATPIQPTMSGNQYQQAMRGLAGYKAEMPKAGFEADYRDALSGVQDTLKGVMMRQGGEGVIGGLGRADNAHRNSKVLGKAITAAKNTDGVFMPSQLNNASSQNAQKFGGNSATKNRPFYDLATEGQKVLPSKLADSGTALRVGVGGGLLTALTGGAGLASGGDLATTAGVPIATTGVLSLLGTKQGQKLLVKAIMDRPDSVRRAGGIFGSRKAKRAIAGAGAGGLLALGN